MRRVRLIHWNAVEAEERIARIRAAGYNVAYKPLAPDTLRELKAHPPVAVVIDLARLPMQGRDVGLAIRHSKSTRHVPLVFVDGHAEKVARVRKSLPDAIYTTWGRIRSSLERAFPIPYQSRLSHARYWMAIQAYHWCGSWASNRNPW